METKLLNKRNIRKKRLFLAFFAVALAAAFVIWKNDVRVKGSISRKLPILVMIDNEKKVVESASTDVTKVLAENNIEVFPEDQISTELILDPVAEGGAGQKIIVKRAPKLIVLADGKETVLRSWAKTIEEILIEKNFPVGPRDIIKPVKETFVGNGAYVEITRVNEVEEEKEIAIPFETKIQKDYWLPSGQTKIQKAGVNGVKKQIFKVVYRNGIEHSRKLILQETVSQPVAQAVLRGVKPTNDRYNRWPVLVAAGTKYGVDPEAMFSVMMCESKGYQYAGQFGSHKGIFQWDGSFYSWAEKVGHGGADIFDVTAQAYATALRVSKFGWSAWGCKP